MVLIDTNIIAYLLIEDEQTEAAHRLRGRDPDWRSEAFLLIEFTNVLARYIAIRRMTWTLAEQLLGRAEALLEGKLGRISHAEALIMAARCRVTAYDARFLVLAQQLDSRLVTEDAKLRAAAPKLTQSLAQALVST